MESKKDIEQTSSLIGKYLLAGWVLTDKVCQTPNCDVPLLRSKDGATWFCVDCKEKPRKSQVDVQSQTPDDVEINYGVVQDILLKAAEVNKQEGGLLNPQFQSEETIKDEQRLRREQSQRASQSIGQYLLSGWALIDETCPNETCFGIPLVRDRSKKKFCVNCQNYYMNGSDLDPAKHKIIRGVVSQPAAFPEARSSTGYELKHDIDTKEVESALQFENAHVKNHISSSGARLKDGISNDTLQESIASLSSLIRVLTGHMEIFTKDHLGKVGSSYIKETCDAIKSCAQALEILVSLKRNEV